MAEGEEEIPTAPWYVWLGLSAIAGISFWCQATVTEERLVPALNVMSDYYNIPNDIAGATLMAAGASSPELFSSIVALFITHSSLGLGTIVGSEIFNQLIICAGSVFASKNGRLQLDKAIVTREVGFYALGIILLYLALQDVEPLESDPDGPKHIFINFWEALMVFSGYILYVIVCANFESICKFFTKAQLVVDAAKKSMYGSMDGKSVTKMDIDVQKMPFVLEKKNLSSEPVANWNTVQYFRGLKTRNSDSFYHDDPMNASVDESKQQEGGGDGGGEDLRLVSPTEIRRQSSTASNASDYSSSANNFLSKYIRDSMRKAGTSYTRQGSIVSLLRHSERPSDLYDLYDIESNEEAARFSCFMWQQSKFYTKAYFGSHAWHLRWFTITTEKITSVPDRMDPEKHRLTYPKFNKIQVDEARLIIRIENPVENKRDYTLMAPSRGIFDLAVLALEKYMELHFSIRPSEQDSTRTSSTDDNLDEEFVDAEEDVDLIEFPSEGTNLEIFFWLILFPLRFLMHYTVPDVRQSDRYGETTTTIGQAYFATFMCLVWLIVGSYAMVASLEALAKLMDIPDSVIGVTVSAAGTSLPNYVASKVAAENGFGNQAVSNAFGSNTFNIMVGLGLPWVLYTSFGTGFEPYTGLKDEGILESIIILFVVLLVFIILMMTTNFVILKWHGYLFIGLYICYLALAIVPVYM